MRYKNNLGNAGSPAELSKVKPSVRFLFSLDAGSSEVKKIFMDRTPGFCYPHIAGHICNGCRGPEQNSKTPTSVESLRMY